MRSTLIAAPGGPEWSVAPPTDASLPGLSVKREHAKGSGREFHIA
jgi:hypothetical protein